MALRQRSYSDTPRRGFRSSDVRPTESRKMIEMHDSARSPLGGLALDLRLEPISLLHSLRRSAIISIMKFTPAEFGRRRKRDWIWTWRESNPRELSFADMPRPVTTPIEGPATESIHDRGVEKGKTGRVQPALLTVPSRSSRRLPNRRSIRLRSVALCHPGRSAATLSSPPMTP